MIGRTSCRLRAARRQPRSRQGFTLLEMLIASALVATLMGSVWGLSNLYIGLLKSGRAQASEQQIARSLTQMLADDLLSVPFSEPAEREGRRTPVDSGSGALSGADEPPELVTETYERDSPTETFDPLETSEPESESAEPAYELQHILSMVESSSRDALPEFSLVGTGTSLQLTVAQTDWEGRILGGDESELDGEDGIAGGAGFPDAPRTAASVGEFGAQSPEDDDSRLRRAPQLRRITYTFEEPHTELPNDPRPPPGLLRYAIRWESLGALREALSAAEEYAGDTSGSDVDLDALPFSQASMVRETGQGGIGSAMDDEPTQFDTGDFELISEVVKCRFQYFDGYSWRSSWDSRRQRALPVAVKIELWLVSTDELKLIRETLSPEEDAERVDEPLLAFDEELEADPLLTIRPRRYEKLVVLGASIASPEFSEADDAYSSGFGSGFSGGTR